MSLTFRQKFKDRARRAIGLVNDHDFVAALMKHEKIETALDIGCGSRSPLSPYRPEIWTVGIEANKQAAELAIEQNVHDVILHEDITKLAIEDLYSKATKHDASSPKGGNRGEKFDLATLFGVIEHMPKNDGLKLLAELPLIAKRIMIETPNGFVLQRAVGDNQYQRHLSGWDAGDFIAAGFTVFGTTGLKSFHGEEGKYKYDIWGIKVAELLLWTLLRPKDNYRHAFNLLAQVCQLRVPEACL